MTNFIEKAANDFGAAINERVLNELVRVLDEEVGLYAAIEKYNQDAVTDNERNITELIAKNPEAAEEYRDLKPQILDTFNKALCFNFWYELLLKSGKSILHDLDDGGNLVIKVFTIDRTEVIKIKTSYSVTA